MAAADFLRLILADPDADGPRLVYADWLDDQGEHARQNSSASSALHLVAGQRRHAATFRAKVSVLSRSPPHLRRSRWPDWRTDGIGFAVSRKSSV